MSAPRLLLGLALSAGLAAAADPAPPRATPAWNWALPLFTNEGFHSMTLRGTEVHPVSSDRIDVVDINITTFSGDAGAQVESSLLSPSASFFPRENRASGDQSVRMIRFSADGEIAAEITGEDWTYEQAGKKVSIRRQAHVVFAATMNDILK
jgi:hypothetical protein